MPEGVEPEIEALRAAGFSIECLVENEGSVDIIVRKYNEETRVQWLFDDEFCQRFFPAEVDEELGYRLHPADAAVNKVLCASRRRQARDAVDVMTIAADYAPLGPLAWAAAGKAEVSPVALLRDLHTQVREFSEPEIQSVRMDNGAAPPMWEKLRAMVSEAIEKANGYCEEVAPIGYDGHLFVDADRHPVEADENAIKSGKARAVPLTNFGPKVVIT